MKQSVRYDPSFVSVRALFVLLGLPVLVLGAHFAPDDKPLPYMTEKGGILYPDEPVKPGEEPATGVQKPFPPMVMRGDNPTTSKKVELGRLLFFDPILSGDNMMSCAHCHHPDLGFSDGLPRARGKGSVGVGAKRKGGIELPRAAPTLWNALYNHRQFWDGRASDLEDQAQNPIKDASEMNQDPEELVRELKAIPQYRQLFDRAFGGQDGSAVTFENVHKAIAAFERTLVSFNSRFDRYAAGEVDALTPQEKRGLKLFLSTKTRCSECHGLPTFANRDFKVVGVPDPPGGPKDVHNPNAEPGRGGGPTGAFKIPTLRNIALTAPYMHNGIFKNLEEVLDFYSKGGGRGRGLEVPLQDDKIREFKLTPQEKKDLIAFLHTLTDESAKPEFPERVPSGLPVVPRVQGPKSEVQSPKSSRQLDFQSSTRKLKTESRKPKTIEVKPGQSIQEAVDRARRGDTIRVYPGVYHEDVLVIYHDITIEGVLQDGKRPVLDGRGQLADAVVALGNRFTIQGLVIRNYQGNGVVVHKAKAVAFRDLIVDNTGLYGVYPIECDGVLVERCVVSRVRDAGIYVGQSRNIIVRNNEVYKNVAGIEIENSVNALVENNYAHDNTAGIMVFVLPFNPSKVGTDTKVVNNRVLNNNTPNFGDPNAIVSNVLKGTGIMVLAADRTEITGNEVAGNDTVGIAVVSLLNLFPPDTHFDVEPFPDENWIHANILKENGKNPDERLKKYGLTGRDLIWDLSGHGNAWHQPGATTFPERLPEKQAKS